MATSTKQTYMDLNTQKALKKLQTSYIRKHFVFVFYKHLHISQHLHTPKFVILSM